jgi:hypothetical protein
VSDLNEAATNLRSQQEAIGELRELLEDLTGLVCRAHAVIMFADIVAARIQGPTSPMAAHVQFDGEDRYTDEHATHLGAAI